MGAISNGGPRAHDKQALTTSVNLSIHTRSPTQQSTPVPLLYCCTVETTATTRTYFFVSPRRATLSRHTPPWQTRHTGVGMVVSATNNWENIAGSLPTKRRRLLLRCLLPAANLFFFTFYRSKLGTRFPSHRHMSACVCVCVSVVIFFVSCLQSISGSQPVYVHRSVCTYHTCGHQPESAS